ncbi:hypothetical protein [Brevundimonas sp. TWP2-3-4b2]|uniref:hypothetical protein n=1 Tax=Brevundimonas sp. TWP2-3-4b2 TaxID=2804595 RepID=UPI003CE9B181
MNVTPAGPGAVSRTAQEKMRDQPSVLDYIPVAEHPAIRAGTSTTDLSTYVTRAIAALGVVYFPAGRYNFNIKIADDNCGLVGEAMGVQDLAGVWGRGTVFWPANYALPMVKLDPMAAGRIINNLTFRDFYAFGFNDGPFLQTNGNSPTRRSDTVEFTNVFVQRFGHGFDIGGGGLDWRLTNLQVQTCLNDGIHIDTANSACNGWLWSKCSFMRNGRHGWYGRKTDIATEVSYSHVFVSCGSEYNGTDAAEPVSRGWYFENFDQVVMIGCTGENDRVGGDLIDIEFEGTTARNTRIDTFHSIGADRAIKFGATLQHGSVSNVRTLLRFPSTTAIEVVSGNNEAGGAEPRIVIDRPTIRGGNVTVSLGVNGRYDATYADGSGPMDVINLDAGWMTGVDRVIDMRSSLSVLLLAGTAARAYGTTLTNIQPGAEYTIEVHGVEPVVLPAALMASGAGYSIQAGKQARLRAGSYPFDVAKLRPVFVSPGI